MIVAHPPCHGASDARPHGRGRPCHLCWAMGRAARNDGARRSTERQCLRRASQPKRVGVFAEGCDHFGDVGVEIDA